jgi:hypothetical protein
MHDFLSEEEFEAAEQVRVEANQQFLESQLDAVRTGDPDLVFACGVHDEITLNVSAPDDYPLSRCFGGEGEVRSALAAYMAVMQAASVTYLMPEPWANLIFRVGHARCVMASGQSATLSFIERFNYRDQRLAYVQIVMNYVTSPGEAGAEPSP